MIFHITSVDEWNSALTAGKYSTPTFNREKFIHCSEKEQLLGVANRIFAGKKQLVLLCIDESKVKGNIVRENLDGGSSLFPHIYAPLNMDSVIQVLRFEPGENGVFRLPPEIS